MHILTCFLNAIKNKCTVNTDPAPEAKAFALGFGHPSLGLTIRRLSIPKFSIARAADPIFSPIWGRTKIKIGFKITPILSLTTTIIKDKNLEKLKNVYNNFRQTLISFMRNNQFITFIFYKY